MYEEQRGAVLSTMDGMSRGCEGLSPTRSSRDDD